MVAEKTCNQGHRNHFAERIEAAREAFENETLQFDEIENLSALIERCNYTFESFDVTTNDFNRWRTMAVENGMTLLRERVEHYSHFRPVDGEIAALQAFAQLHGVEEVPSERLKTLRRNGVQAVAQERQSCQPAVDLRGPRLGPVRDQGEIGWCYAFATADLVTYHTGTRVSALGIALTYNQRPGVASSDPEKRAYQLENYPLTPQSSLEGGTAASALEQAQVGGMCLESELRSEENGTSHLLTHMREIETTLENPENCEDTFHSVQALFPNVEFQDFVEVLETATMRSILPDLAERACTPQELPAMRPVVVESNSTIQSKKNLFRAIDERLSENQPVAISYDAENLSDIYFNPPSNSPHVSTLVGRRFNEESGQCEYLLRNTWGRGCGGYHSSYTCEEGHIWIPKGALTRSVRDATYIQ